jgi:hypothetical protein
MGKSKTGPGVARSAPAALRAYLWPGEKAAERELSGGASTSGRAARAHCVLVRGGDAKRDYLWTQHPTRGMGSGSIF